MSTLLRFLTRWPVLTFVVALAGCGGGSDSAQPQAGPAAISTLAYVVSACGGSGVGGTIRQSLQIRQADQAPITVADVMSPVSPAAVLGCAFSGEQREGSDFGAYGVFHRLGVSPDGSQVAFEVTDEVAEDALLFPRNMLPPNEKGIFAVRADGKDLHRVAPASRESVEPPNSAPAFTLAFSPDGRLIAYTDRDDQDAVQIFTADLDLVDGGRNQVTHLPPAPPQPPQRTCCPIFADAETISFLTIADPFGTNPNHDAVNATVKTDGTGLTVTQPPVAIPGSQVVATFQITGKLNPFLLRFTSPPPVNPHEGFLNEIQDVFATDGVNVLQLTNFQRQDTWNPTLSADGQRVFFSASANLGDNPNEECQVFSTDVLGGDLRQVTNFHEVPYPEGTPSPTGCHSGPRPDGCTVFYTGRDTPSDTLLFYSSCDPFGTNPYGDQLFAMHPDGTGLRQLTNTQGYQPDPASHTFSFETPFPWAHPGQQDNT